MVNFESAEEIRAKALVNREDPSLTKKIEELKNKLDIAARNGQFWIRPNTVVPTPIIDELKQLGYKVNVDKTSGIVYSISWAGSKRSS